MKDPRGDRTAANSALRAIPKLVEAAAMHSPERAMQIAEEIAAGLSESMPSIGERLMSIKTKTDGLRGARLPEDLLRLYLGDTGIEDIVLPASVTRSAMEIVQESRAAERLAAFHTSPRNRVLLHGPPGNGKTLLARAMAHEIGLPLVEVKFGGLIGSYLGETGKNLQRVFDYVGSVRCILFIDEFDTIGTSRTQSNDVGESKRITNQMLLLLDRLPPTSYVFAATNLFGLVDPALARRFDFDILIPAPTEELALACALKELAPEKTPGYDCGDLAEAVAMLRLPHLSGVVKVCERIRRDFALNEGANVEAILADLYAARPGVTAAAADE